MLRPWKLEIRIDHSCEKAVYLQIADAIIADIRSGRLKAGNALPGSRILAEMLGVNRNTVVEALNVLLNEEWIVSRSRKGTFVSDLMLSATKHDKAPLLQTDTDTTKNIPRIIFDDGIPDSKIAPVKELAAAYREIFNQTARWQMMGYSSEYGNPAFIQTIVQMLNQQRGMHLNTNNLCITRGSQMALFLVAKSLIRKGDYVLVENPGYKPAWKAFETAGATLLPVQVDNDGIVISDVIAHLKQHPIKAIYTTPHHQYPTTVTLSLQRRQELIRLSNEHGLTIIEDDYDNEFHYGYRPVLPLCSFPELLNAIYIGTMSKVVAPALRIGYLASNNEQLINEIAALRKIIDVQGDAIMEQAILQLLLNGTIRKHIRKATLHYKTKRDFVASLLDKYLKEKANYRIPEGGLAVWIAPNKKVNWTALIAQLSENGVKVPMPDYYIEDGMNNGLRMGFGSLCETMLTEGIKLLAKYLPG